MSCSAATTLGFILSQNGNYTHAKLPGITLGINPHGRFLYKGVNLNYDPSWDETYDPEDEESGEFYPDDVKMVGKFLLRDIVAKLNDGMRPIFSKFSKEGFINSRTKIHDGAFMACLYHPKLDAHPGIVYTIDLNYTEIEISGEDFLKANIDLPTIWNPKNNVNQRTAPDIQEQLHKICMAISNLTVEVQTLKQSRAKK